MAIRRPAEVFPPGEILKEELEARGWTQVDLAEILGRSVSLVNEIIAGKRGITAETARGLAAAFGTSAEFWMNLESAYQLWRVREDGTGSIARRARIYSKAPVKDMLRRGWIEPSNNVDLLEKRILDFFEIESLDQEPRFQVHAARKSTSYETVTPAQNAWLFRARQLARAVRVEGFSEDKLDAALEELRLLLRAPEETRRVPDILANAGIRFVVVEPLPSTRIDGACFWLDQQSPVIALSLRFDRIDNFWHTLMHELGHLKDRNESLDTELENRPYDTATDGPEQSADRFATEYLVPQRQLEGLIARVRPLYSRTRIVGFASSMNVHPGIVVGQLQHRREIVWSSLRALLVPIREVVTSAALTDGWGARLPAGL